MVVFSNTDTFSDNDVVFGMDIRKDEGSRFRIGAWRDSFMDAFFARSCRRNNAFLPLR